MPSFMDFAPSSATDSEASVATSPKNTRSRAGEFVLREFQPGPDMSGRLLKRAVNRFWHNTSGHLGVDAANVLARAGVLGVHGFVVWLSKTRGTDLIASLPFVVAYTRYLELADLMSYTPLRTEGAAALSYLRRVLPRYRMEAELTGLRASERGLPAEADMTISVRMNFAYTETYTFEFECGSVVEPAEMTVGPKAKAVLLRLLTKPEEARAGWVGMIEAEDYDEDGIDWSESYETFSSSWPVFEQARLVSLRHDAERVRWLSLNDKFNVRPLLPDTTPGRIRLNREETVQARKLFTKLCGLLQRLG